MTFSGAPFKTDIPPRIIIPFGKTDRLLNSAQQPSQNLSFKSVEEYKDRSNKACT